MRTIILLVFVVSSLGCATAKTVIGPHGKEMHTLNCSGIALSWGSCLEKAGQICGANGYDIIAGGGANYGTSVTATTHGLFASPVIYREMVIQCK